MLREYSAVSVAVMGVLVAGAAVAADIRPVPGSMFEPKTVRAGGLEIMPWLGVVLGRDTNVGLSNGVQTATNFTLLNPNLTIDLPTHGQLYGANYSGALSRYTASSIDNYNDHNFNLFADNTWSSRLNTLVNVDYVKGHDARNALLFKNKELWHASGINAIGHYGAEGAQGQFELSAGVMSKRYDSDNSGSTRSYNYDRTDLSGTFFYKVAPATQMFVEADNARFSYVDVASKKYDSTEQRYLVGVKWEATAKTTGIVKLGTAKKSFNLGIVPSGTTPIWTAEVIWNPKTYSRVDVALNQKTNEFGGSGSSFIVARDAAVNWAHDWSSYVTSTLSLGDGADTFRNIARVDKRLSYGMKLTYGFRPWLRAGVEYQHSKRTSNVPINEYKKAVTMFTLEGSL